MSETEQKEIEVVAGVIEGVTQKKPDTWQVGVKPDGSQYTKNLWTKDSELVTALTAKLGQHGAFVCSASYWTNQSGANVRSLWINSLSNEPAGSVPASEPATSQQKSSTEGMSKEEWARKDAAIHEMACIKTAADALKHTLPSDPSEDDLRRFLGRTAYLTAAWMRAVLSIREGEEIPFEPAPDSAHDDEIPY